MVSVKKKLVFCQGCQSYGHADNECKMKGIPIKICKSCNDQRKNHSGRNCKSPIFTASYVITDAMRDIDNIPRDPLRVCTVVEPRSRASHRSSRLNR